MPAVYGETKEGVVVVVRGKRVIVISGLRTTYQILNRRIRSARVAMIAIVITEIMAGDTVTEVDDESVFGSIESVHW